VKIVFVAPGYHPRVGGVEYATNADRTAGHNGETMVSALQDLLRESFMKTRRRRGL